MKMKNAISCFLIPVTDMDRAIKFYNSILCADLKTHEALGGKAAVLPRDNESGRTFIFLRNNFHLRASEIAQLYNHRYISSARKQEQYYFA